MFLFTAEVRRAPEVPLRIDEGKSHGLCGPRQLNAGRGESKLRLEYVAAAFPPVVNVGQGGAYVGPWLPTCIARKLRKIGCVDQLIARTALLEDVVYLFAGQFFDQLHQFQQRDRVLRSTTDVIDLPFHSWQSTASRIKGAHQVADVEHIPYLATVAKNSEPVLLQSGVEKMCHPALVLIAELLFTGDA